jgi:outer membrane protein OmpU
MNKNERTIMNNIKKIGLSALAGSLALTGAHAAEYSVSGDAQVIFNTAEGNENGAAASNGKGISTDMDLYFNASGELDNGFTVSFFQALDTHGSDAGTDSVHVSSSQVTLGMGSLGTIQVNNNSGSAANSIDDVLPKAYEEAWDGTTHSRRFDAFGSNTQSGSVDYRTPAIDLMGVSISATATYDPSAGNGPADSSGAGVATSGASGTAYTVKLAHESGLTIGGGFEEADDFQGNQGQKNATGYVLFSSGPISVGYQESYEDTATGGTTNAEGADTEGEGYSIAYTAGDISVSYAKINETELAVSNTAALQEVEMTAVQASYTMGAMTLAASVYKTDNAEGVAGDDYEETELSASFAF